MWLLISNSTVKKKKKVRVKTDQIRAYGGSRKLDVDSKSEYLGHGHIDIGWM